MTMILSTGVRKIYLVAFALALLILWGAGCANGPSTDEPRRRIVWTPSTEANCLPWTEEADLAMDEAATLWSQWGVSVERGAYSVGTYAVAVCLYDGFENPHQLGKATHQGDRFGRIRVRDANWAIFTHELGHLILPGVSDEDHLPFGDPGIMGAQIAGCPGGNCGWSEGDIAHLETFGLEFTR